MAIMGFAESFYGVGVYGKGVRGRHLPECRINKQDQPKSTGLNGAVIISSAAGQLNLDSFHTYHELWEENRRVTFVL